MNELYNKEQYSGPHLYRLQKMRTRGNISQNMDKHPYGLPCILDWSSKEDLFSFEGKKSFIFALLERAFNSFDNHFHSKSKTQNTKIQFHKINTTWHLSEYESHVRL